MVTAGPTSASASNPSTNSPWMRSTRQRVGVAELDRGAGAQQLLVLGAALGAGMPADDDGPAAPFRFSLGTWHGECS